MSDSRPMELVAINQAADGAIDSLLVRIRLQGLSPSLREQVVNLLCESKRHELDGYGMALLKTVEAPSA